MKTVVKIGGMHCGNCKKRLEGFFTAIEGVKEAEVDLESASARIESESQLDLAFLKEEIEDMGFEFLGKED